MLHPMGRVADKSSDFGLQALHSNANAASYGAVSQLATTVANAVVVTQAMLLTGVINMTAGANGAFTITLPTTAQIISALGPTIPTDGTFGKVLQFINVAIGQTGTVTAGDTSTTVTGTATIATNVVREFLLNVTSATTVTVTNLGAKAI
jgi:hypothetical protein